MQYTTICLNLLEQNPVRYAELQRSKATLHTLNQLALTLRTRHQEILIELQKTLPEAGCKELSSQAMELATAQLEEELCLPSGESEASADN